MGDRPRAVNRGQGILRWPLSLKARNAPLDLGHVPASRRRHVTWTHDLPPGSWDQADLGDKPPAGRCRRLAESAFLSALAAFAVSVTLIFTLDTAWALTAFIPWAVLAAAWAVCAANR